ncbi:hypothetical protein AB0V79_08545 [Mesorhizobium ciceri]|uniref:hypothetical protein n=1 Tax=Mesorhizobium TaxID=68287 RepID=UPI0007A94BD1|nr:MULTISPECIES: hypothetical protein [Mesorhizobium]RVA52952.1 hypothetical protein EN933_13880 [Mesorhizobium sp. M7A.F.Ca.US.001.01.1.1]TIU40721.1 MAG: hypothetical protein E5W26_08960 [Mesorhizobium sp.]AMY03178.1 hypothetical protein A4R29_29480 [Mesorhizobium ciceri biovar biserrulae]ARP62655.1 hypothetical protein A9K65_004095 [Mesorhizobium sp. WSM1497]MBZ9717466.1 hypothetical protein [Mesorhizobium sp. AD1-1]
MENEVQITQTTTYTERPAEPIRLVMGSREMRCYTVTDSELKQLGLANLAISGTFGIGSAFFAFGLDVYKDTEMAAQIPAAAQAMVGVVQPICLYIGIALWIASGALLYWRHGMLDIIKKESKS